MNKNQLCKPLKELFKIIKLPIGKVFFSNLLLINTLISMPLSKGWWGHQPWRPAVAGVPTRHMHFLNLTALTLIYYINLPASQHVNLSV